MREKKGAERMAQKAFDKALANFVQDFASGDAVRHLADRGFTVTEIVGKLSFPTKKETVAEMVWKHYLNTGIIVLEKPQSGNFRKVSYVQEQDAYGKTWMRQVTEEVPAPEREYLPCSFGKELYKDKAGFEKKLQGLSQSDRDYILDLPWPLATVWHAADERMKRITRFLEETQER